MPFEIPSSIFNAIGLRLGKTAAWRRDNALSEAPSTSNPSPQTPYVDVVTLIPQTGPRFFWAIFDNIIGDIAGKTFIGSYRASQWTYLDDYVAVYRDNGNNILDPADTLIGRFDTGSDWGGLTGDNSQGSIRLLSQTQGEITNSNGVRIDQLSITTPTTYTITPSAIRRNEGQTLTTNMRTTGVAAGTTLYWSLNGNGINESDFSSGALTGSTTVKKDGTLSFSHTIKNDRTTEGNETLTIRIFSDADRTLQVGSTATVTVVDTSRAAPTYTITPSATAIDEGQALTTNVTITGVAAGTTLYYSLNGKGINATDFSPGTLTGSAAVGADGSLSFAHTLANDLTTEGNETLAIRLFSDANRKRQVGSTTKVIVVDTSKRTAPVSDSITGQKLIFSDLGTIESDKVYGKENYRWLQPIFNNTGFTKEAMDSLTEFKIEFEFNNQYIIATAAVRGESRDAWINTNGIDWSQRIVLKGSFSYDNSRISKAKIESYAWQLVSQSPPRNLARAEQDGYAIFASGSKLSADGNAISTTGFPYPAGWSPLIKDPSSWQSIFSNHVNPRSIGLDVDIQGNPFSYFIPGTESNTSLVKPNVDQFSGGRFFYSGWETNPFNSNLI
jgi:hypothetical protein